MAAKRPTTSPPPSSHTNNNDTSTSKSSLSAQQPSSPSSPKPKRSLRILCFGDSLTSGFSESGTASHPYSQSLATVLSRAFPSLKIEPFVDGLPGDTVCEKFSDSRFLSRIEPKFLTKGGGTPYDWTIVLGGTNDLNLSALPEEIYEGLKKVWAVPLSKGGRVLACTVPEAWSQGPRAKAARSELNTLIRGHKRENFYVFDLNAAIPYHSLSDEEQVQYWNDQVHMTPRGYDLMGEKIAAALVNIIMPPGRLQSNGARPAAKRRRLFKDDDKVFDEEDGDDSLLDQGYIVVRRKDLE